MAIHYTCSCGQILHAPESAVGHMARCPACKAISPVPPMSAVQGGAGTVRAEVVPAGGGEGPETVRRGFGAGAARVGEVRKARPPLFRPVSGAFPSRITTAPGGEGFGAWRFYLYVAIALMLVPLVVWPMRASARLDWSRRVIATYEAHAGEPGVKEKREAAAAEWSKNGSFGNLDFLPFLPNGRVDTALFPHDSSMQWWFWPLALAGVCALLVPAASAAGSGRGVTAGIVAGSTLCGMFVLVILHAMIGSDDFPWMLIGWLVDFSYTTGMERHVPLIGAILAFAVFAGVGMESLKAGPLLIGLFQSRGGPTWQQVMVRGLAIGMGLGAAEATLYADWFYNGIEGGDAYLVRFISLVALQGVWTASAGLTLLNQKARLEDLAGRQFAGMFFVYLLGPILLHATVAASLMREARGVALLAGIASVGWLVFQVERLERRGA